MLPRLNVTQLSIIAALLVAGVMIAFGLSGCASAPKGPMMMPPSAVITRKISDTKVPVHSEYVATLISRQSVSLQSQVAGQIRSIYVKAGDLVHKGALLLEVDPAQQQAAVASSAAAAQSQRANIEQARAQLQTLQEQRSALESAVQLAQSQYNRYENLASTNSVSRQEVERFRDELARAQSNLQANDAQLNAQRAAITTAQKLFEQSNAATRQQQVLLQYYRITAPFTGVVGDIPVKVGNYIQPNIPLLSVTNNSPLEININVPAEKASQLRQGLPVQVVDENGALLGQTSLTFVSPNVDTDSQTILVKANLPNTAGTLKADQVVNARIVWKETFGVRVPTEAVVHMGGRDFVYVVAPKPPAKPGDPKPISFPGMPPMPEAKHIAKLQPIVASRIEGSNYIVETGLKPGDEIIISGIQKLSDGAAIYPKSADSAQSKMKPEKPGTH